MNNNLKYIDYSHIDLNKINIFNNNINYIYDNNEKNNLILNINSNNISLNLSKDDNLYYFNIDTSFNFS